VGATRVALEAGTIGPFRAACLDGLWEKEEAAAVSAQGSTTVPWSEEEWKCRR
jgi:hypothetical protein